MITTATPAPLALHLLRQLKRTPRDPGPLLQGARRTAALAQRAWLHGYHRLHIDGRGHLPPADRSFVMVANHASHLDALCLLAALPLNRLDRAYPAAADDYFFSDLPRGAACALLLNALPFERFGDSEGSLERCRRLLATPGNILILFPEGTRSADGRLGRFRSGVGRLVAGTSIPVVPCHLAGADRAWGKGKVWPRPRSLRLRIGPPRRFDRFGTDRPAVQRACRRLQAAVAMLAAEEEAT